jgi:hypothetical protein
MARHPDPATREKGLCISFQRNTGMLRFTQNDGGRLMWFANLPNTTLLTGHGLAFVRGVA